MANVTKSYNKEIIPAYYTTAIDLKYKGYTSKKIKLEIFREYSLDFHEASIRRWFCVTGLLRELYEQHANEMIEIEKRIAVDYLKGNIKKAAITLAKVMSGEGGAAQVMAANAFLDRGLGKVKEEVQQNVNFSGSIALVDVLKVLDKMGVDDINKIIKQNGSGTDNKTSDTEQD